MNSTIENYNNILNIKTTKIKDLIISLSFSIILFILFVLIDAFDLLIDFTRDHEDWELDEVILFIIVLSFSALWYSIRRFNEMSKLQKEFKDINETLEEKLDKEIKKSNRLLEEKNSFLQIKVDEAILEMKKQNNIMSQQSKMATMGEMMESIAHQWKQPLSIITASASSLKMEQEIGIIDAQSITKKAESILNNGEYLSNTIDDFRNFLNNDKEEKAFNLQELTNNTLKLISSNFKNKDIETIQKIEDIEIVGQPNELIQVFMNILNNAKDELLKKELPRYIFIDIKKNNQSILINIKDNAGGVPADILPNIFDPYFTTKGTSGGTGIGLYMSKRIIEKSFNGSIDVTNQDYEFNEKKYIGAEFKIIFPNTK